MPRSLSARYNTSLVSVIDPLQWMKGKAAVAQDLHSDIACILQTEVRIRLMLLCHGGILFGDCQSCIFLLSSVVRVTE